MTFLSTSDQTRYGKLLEDVENQHTQGYRGVFSTNIVEAYHILTHWRCESKNFTRMMDTGLNNGVFFNTEGRGNRSGRGGRSGRRRRSGQNGQVGDCGGRGRRGAPAIIYYNCNKPGHKSNVCPDFAKTGEET